MIRLLTFTNLYPSAGRPRHGIFVEQRLRRLVETGTVRACVVVPVARGPFAADPSPATAERFGIPVRYVGFPAVRGLTTFLNPLVMAVAALRAVREMRSRHGDFDLIDAHFLYPDGVAAVLLGAWLGKPVLVTARGSDVNVAARERVAGACIRWAARRAAAVISVSEALRIALMARGVAAGRITVVRNGVDLATFRPLDRAAVRAGLGVTGPLLLCVGNLVPEKGYDLVLEALTRLPNARLIVIGDGPEEQRLQESAHALGLAGRVTWLAPVAQGELGRFYNAADVTVLASTREGMPNVLLESLACGTPVVATAVGGSTEIVASTEAGRLVPSRTAAALAAACQELLDSPPERTATRRYAERFGWAEPVAAQLALLGEILGGRPAVAGSGPLDAH